MFGFCSTEMLVFPYLFLPILVMKYKNTSMTLNMIWHMKQKAIKCYMMPLPRLTLIWVVVGGFSVGFPLITQKTVKTVTLAFCSIQ